MSGAGSITKLANGDHGVWVSAGVNPDTGKRVRIFERVSGTYRQAQTRLAAMRSDIDAGRYIASGPETFGAFIERWWPQKAQALAPTTAQGYRHLLDRVILPKLSKRPIQKIAVGEIAGLLAFHIERGRVGEADHAFVLLRHIFRKAVQMGAIAKSPLNGLERPKSPHREMNIISPADWGRVRQHLAKCESWWLPAFHLAITSGLRRSEIAGLKWQDLDADRGLIVVRRAVHALRAGQWIEREPKSERSRRVVALDRGTVDVLLDHRRASERVAKMFGREMFPADFMFARSDGQPWEPDAYSRAWRAVCKRVNLPGIRMHDLRHSAASYLLASGIAPHVVSERLGHSKVAFTMQIYGHVLPTQQAEAAERLADILGGKRLALPIPA